MIDIRQSDKYASYLKKIGWKVESVDQSKVYIKKIPLLGSVVKVQRPGQLNIKKIETVARKNKASQIIIEPKNSLDAKFLLSLGYKQSKKPYLPSKTLHLDLTKTKSEIQENMQKDARSATDKTNNLIVEKITLKDLEEFRKIWKKTIGIKRHVPSLNQLKKLKETFKKSSLFLLKGDSGAIFLKSKKIAYYWQAFTGPMGRKNLSQYKLVWEGILWAKSKEVKIFDFEGIFDSRFPDKSWKGFTHFKKSFGGEEIEYPGALSKKMLPL